MKGGKYTNMRNKYKYICYGIIVALFQLLVTCMER